MSLLQAVPEFFQSDGGIPVSVRPKNGDHLPENSHAAGALRGLRNNLPDYLGKRPGSGEPSTMNFAKVSAASKATY